MTAGAIGRTALVTLAATLAVATTAHAQAPPVLAELERGVAADPEDVDQRLRLASALAWAGRRDDARREARAVLARAPAYLDAELLLARLDAWDARWPAARARLTRVLAAHPHDLDTRLLAVDVALWSGDLAGAERGLAAIQPTEIGAVEHWYREAQIAVGRLDSRRARALAGQILKVDPRHAGARGLRATVNRVSVESATDVEIYPRTYPSRLAFGETVSATGFPRARWSVTLIYELRRRFATDNHRVAARADWRPTDRVTLLGFVRAGAVEVLPRFTAIGEARWDRRGWLIGGRYTYDLMPWAGDLHRAHAIAGIAPARRVRIEAEGMLGVLRGCDTSTRVWGARGRVIWHPAPWELAVTYGYGLEADRAAGGADPCASPTVDLIDRAVHAGALDVTRAFGRLSIRLGYGLERREAGDLVHLGGLAVRTWF